MINDTENDAGDLTLSRSVDSYLEFHRELRSSAWNTSNSYVLRKFVEEMTGLGCPTIESLQTANLQTWLYQKARTVKIQTAAAYLFHIRHFLGWVIEQLGLEKANPALKVKVPRYVKEVRTHFLSQPEAQRLIDHCPDDELRFAIYCALDAGFRFGEVVAARPGWFDIEHRLIHIKATQDWAPKNRKSRPIPMTEEFAEFLELYGLREPYMLHAEKARRGRWRYRYDFSRKFERLTAQLGIDCRFHDLRRTFASLKVSDGVSIYKVAKWCGHRVEIAEKHYGHLIPCDDEIKIGLERRGPVPEPAAPEPLPHQQLTWEELARLCWSMPMTRAARTVGLTDNGLRKMAIRMKVPLPPQGHWLTPPAKRKAPPI